MTPKSPIAIEVPKDRVLRAGVVMILLAILAMITGLSPPARAATGDEDVQTAWRLLDYVAVDYRGAVADGRITSAQEYAEMVEFSSTVEAKIAILPAKPGRTALVAAAMEAATERHHRMPAGGDTGNLDRVFHRLGTRGK